MKNRSCEIAGTKNEIEFRLGTSSRGTHRWPEPLIRQLLYNKACLEEDNFLSIVKSCLP